METGQGSTSVIALEDGKGAKAFRTIGEVSKALDVRPHVLRYWEEQFPMLQPVKRAGGRRLYRPEDIELVATIDRLVHREGYTLRGARQFLEGKGGKAEETIVLTVTEPAPPAPPPQVVEVEVVQVVEAYDKAAVLQQLYAVKAKLNSALAI
jgi:DNA-binding transcriptional MerR regulator